MSKIQRSNRETRKPKKDKAPAKVTATLGSQVKEAENAYSMRGKPRK
jgi:hypothetical protein